MKSNIWELIDNFTNFMDDDNVCDFDTNDLKEEIGQGAEFVYKRKEW